MWAVIVDRDDVAVDFRALDGLQQRRELSKSTCRMTEVSETPKLGSAVCAALRGEAGTVIRKTLEVSRAIAPWPVYYTATSIPPASKCHHSHHCDCSGDGLCKNGSVDSVQWPMKSHESTLPTSRRTSKMAADLRRTAVGRPTRLRRKRKTPAAKGSASSRRDEVR